MQLNNQLKEKLKSYIAIGLGNKITKIKTRDVLNEADPGVNKIID